MPLPMAGVRIIDSTTMVAMPYAMALMADMGAEVVKVDNHTAPAFPAAIHPDLKPGKRHWEWEGNYQSLNRNKLGITLNLKLPEAVQIFKDLVSVSDIVIENNRSGAMERLGLDYKSLCKVKPDIIVLSNTGFGHSGPWQSFPGIGRMMELTCGLSQFSGYTDQGPRRVGYAFFDPHVGWTAMFAVLAALLYRQRTGKGQWIDLSMYQVGTATMGDAILDFIANGRNGNPMGNRHPYLAPHGVYPCKGDDKWIAIAAETQEQWLSLCETMGNPKWARDDRFASNFDRWQNQDELDRHIGQWTKQRDHYELMRLLQERGVTAGAVLNNKEMLLDPHLRGRGFFEEVSHPAESGLGVKPYTGRPFKMSDAECAIRHPAPGLGEHNEYVIRNVLGMDEKEMERLYKIGAIGKELTDPKSRAHALPWEKQLELGIIAGHDEDYKKVLGLE